MKIDAEKLKELGRYAVGIDGWQWFRGMTDDHGRIVTRANYSRDGSFVEFFNAGETPECETYPDFSDPLTVQAVLLMVRKKHGHVSVVRMAAGEVTFWIVARADGTHMANHQSTELEALLAALAVAK